MAPAITKKTPGSDQLLLEKMHMTIKSILASLPSDEIALITGNEDRRGGSSQQMRYSYDEFCRDLDLGDTYSRRILELLIKETLSRKSQRRYVGENPEDDCLYGMQVEELNGVAWEAWDD